MKRPLRDNIYNDKITINEADEEQSSLLNIFLVLINLLINVEEKKNDSYESANALSKGLELPLNAFKTGIFPFRPAQGKELKLITPKEFQ